MARLTLRCDVVGCGATQDFEGERCIDMFADAIEAGWQISGDRDACPIGHDPAIKIAAPDECEATP